MELKQLEYFVACTDQKSFRQAATVLYCTQSSVSKVIKSLEDELGFDLFTRTKTGIEPTAKGLEVYEYARDALASAAKISGFAQQDQLHKLSIYTNPSSWMARTFTDYYLAHSDRETSYKMMSASTVGIIDALVMEKADLGFVYVMRQQLPLLKAQLARQRLSFMPLASAQAVLYLGAKAPQESLDSPAQVDLVQGFEDEFTLKSFWNDFQHADDEPAGFRVAVTTNSDYLMNELLSRTALGNVSSDYLGDPQMALHQSTMSLYKDDTPVSYGCIVRADRELTPQAKQFLLFVRAALKRQGAAK